MLELSKSIFSAVEKIRKTYSKLDRHNLDLRFTPGDRLIGDLGEALAAYLFDLAHIGSKNAKGHDFKAGGFQVQVKATSTLKKGSMIGLGLKKTEFDKLLVFKFLSGGQYEILYNGPGKAVFEATTGTSITEFKLRKLSEKVTPSQALKPKVNPYF